MFSNALPIPNMKPKEKVPMTEREMETEER
jgi:hypothetical protein